MPLSSLNLYFGPRIKPQFVDGHKVGRTPPPDDQGVPPCLSRAVELRPVAYRACVHRLILCKRLPTPIMSHPGSQSLIS